MKTLRLILAMMIAVIANELQVNAQEEKEEDVVFFKVDTMPLYPGGMETMIKDITALVKYPEEALKQGITGKVFTGFVVNNDGKIEYASIARGVDPLLDKEALQVINHLDKTWKSGIKDGKAVNVYFTVVFDFKEDKKIDVSLLKSPH